MKKIEHRVQLACLLVRDEALVEGPLENLSERDSNTDVIEGGREGWVLSVHSANAIGGRASPLSRLRTPPYARWSKARNSCGNIGRPKTQHPADGD